MTNGNICYTAKMKFILLIFIPLQLFSVECKNSEKVIQLGGDKSTKTHLVVGAPKDFVKPPRLIKILPYKNFVIGYSTKSMTPLWAQYRTKNLDLTCTKTHRPTGKFYCDPRIIKNHRCTHDDYKDVHCNRHKSRYNPRKCLAKGHLAPNSLFGCSEKDAKATFITTNIAPQIQNGFNGGIWRSLEQKVKKCARKRDLTVITGVIQGNKRLNNKPAIPYSFYKIIFDHKSGENINFLMKNVPHKKRKDFSPYIRSLKKLETLTGFKYLINTKINKNKLGKLKNWPCIK
ncbi:MAG: DNA/RNA non-specific endonuclease [Deltaproteobacteria bacterium]|nr:MAG: DNA/RNA non-specific endonuclease [Deltaproteobacteria bacterium]